MRGRSLWASSIVIALCLPACGLTLDWDPPDPQGGIDGGFVETDARVPGDDASVIDAGPPPCVEDIDCSDGSWCSGEEHCVEGACERGEPPCPDASACLLRACDDASAACGDFVTTCDDADLCTPDGTCVPRPTCGMDSDCPDDGDPCTGTSECVAGRCTLQPAAPCAGERGCVRNECIPFVGCGEVARHELCGELDGLGCTVPTCAADTGACGETPSDVACDDGLACTDDLCVPGAATHDVRGCVDVPVHTRCDDGATCTENVCAPASPRADATGCVFPPRDEVCRETAGEMGCGESVCVGRDAAAMDGTGCATRLDSSRCLLETEVCGLGALGPLCLTLPRLLCGSDAACDDGNPCNGVERCSLTVCVRATAGCPAAGCEQGWCDRSGGTPICDTRATAACFPML
ncbi:MAG: hypothetical protein M3Y87_19935 [Myxococcota bacterium]|nr:hypothetical protein [Myxococcota bacterium]